jgi:hypothetical protein
MCEKKEKKRLGYLMTKLFSIGCIKQCFMDFIPYTGGKEKILFQSEIVRNGNWELK